MYHWFWSPPPPPLSPVCCIQSDPHASSGLTFRVLLSVAVQSILTPHLCTMCPASLPVSDMVALKSGENVVRLFCTRFCVTSYKLRPAGGLDFLGTRQIV